MPQHIVYGRAAEIFARRFPADAAVVATDPAHPAEALADIARFRRAGTPVLAALCFDDPQALIAEQAVYAILSEIPDESGRRSAYEALAAGTLHFGGALVRDRYPYAIDFLRTAREFIGMADGVLVRSTRERRLLEKTLGTTFRHVVIPQIADPVIIVPDRASTANTDAAPGDLVVYAPEVEGSALLTVLAALPPSQIAVIVSDVRIPGTAHIFVPVSELTRVLPHARVVVDTRIGDPGAAIAFAGHDFGLVCTRTSGADEFIDGAQYYEPGDPRTFTAALVRACITPKTRRRIFATAAEPAVQDFIPAVQVGGPLVSIVVPTFNRPEYVRRTLENLRRQTYANIEAVIVNDGGVPVDDIVAEFPFARSFALQQNAGASRAANLGFAEARGAYIGIIADDDIHYPSHCAYLVHALESSGLSIAHGNMINNLIVRGPNGELLTRGYNLSHDGCIDPIEVYWAMRVAAQSLLMRRSVLDECGLWNENYHVVTDHEFIIRVGLRYDFAHVPVVTNEMRIRDDGMTVSNRNTADYLTETQALFASVAPPGRPLIRDRQAATFESCREAKTTRAAFYPCWTPLPQPMPL